MPPFDADGSKIESTRCPVSVWIFCVNAAALSLSEIAAACTAYRTGALRSGAAAVNPRLRIEAPESPAR